MKRRWQIVTIYLDVIFLENLCMNYIILFATGLIFKVDIKQWRILLSSTIGGVYAILSFAPILEIYSHLLFKILLSIVMVYIAFHPPNVKKLGKELIIFYLVSFVFGGCAFALLYYIKPQDILMKNGLLTGTYPLKIAILGGLVGFVIVNIAFKMVKGKLSKKDMFCQVRIVRNEKEVCLKVMIDTGNLLKDPISGMPVMVAEKTSLEPIISHQIIENLEGILGGEVDTTILCKEEEMPKFRMIPFSSLGKQNGLLLGFLPDAIFVKKEEEEEVKIEKVIVGMYDKMLSKNGGYTGLIGLDILERCDKNEYFTNFERKY